MVKCFLKNYGNKEELSTTCNPKFMSRCLSAPDAISLHHCLQNHRQEEACLKGIFTPFYIAIVVLFQAFPEKASWGDN